MAIKIKIKKKQKREAKSALKPQNAPVLGHRSVAHPPPTSVPSSGSSSSSYSSCSSFLPSLVTVSLLLLIFLTPW
jgi:hypothetical protein